MRTDATVYSGRPCHDIGSALAQAPVPNWLSQAEWQQYTLGALGLSGSSGQQQHWPNLASVQVVAWCSGCLMMVTAGRAGCSLMDILYAMAAAKVDMACLSRPAHMAHGLLCPTGPLGQLLAVVIPVCCVHHHSF